MNAPVPGAAVICLWRDRVLLARRAREPNRGRWSFPGGKIEPGETARAAAEREAHEETGVSVRTLALVDVYDAIFPPYHYTVADFLAEPLIAPEGGPPPVRPGSDASEALWVPFEEVGEYDLTDAMYTVLARARWLRDRQNLAPRCLGEPPPPPHPPVRGLYVITDETLSPPRTHVQIARAALAGGARVVQLRDKQRDAGELLPAAREIATECRTAGALFVVNDRVDLALACSADGVHLGQTDLPLRAARAMLGPRAVIGVSVENEAQARQAVAGGADYLGVGAIYGTASKSDAGHAVGVAHLARIRAAVPAPLVAIGGITRDRVREVRAAGADAVAVIGAVVAAPDMTAAAAELAAACEAPLP